MDKININELCYVHKQAQNPKRIPRKQKKSFRKWFDNFCKSASDEFLNNKQNGI